MEHDEYVERWSAMHGGYVPASNRLVRRWLRGSYLLACPLARARISPHALTIAGVGSAAAAAALAGLGRWAALLAAALVVLSATLDGLDGAVAVLRDRTSRLGGWLDFSADRVGEVLFAAALWATGAAILPCVVAVAVTYAHEYLRLRARARGTGEIGVVTVAERPTRVIVTAAFLAAYAAQGDDLWPSLGAWAWFALAVVGVLQLVRVFKPYR